MTKGHLSSYVNFRHIISKVSQFNKSGVASACLRTDIAAIPMSRGLFTQPDAMLRFLLNSQACFRRAIRSADSVAAAPAPIHLIVGNEAADADSVISAICHAAVRSRQAPVQALQGIPVPVVSCRRADFVLRREAVFLLSGAGVIGSSAATAASDSPLSLQQIQDALVFVDDIQEHQAVLEALSKSKLVAVTLMDHNVAWGPFASPDMSAAVVGIIDHHRDAGQYPHVDGTDREVSFDEVERRGVGSTCTLVAQHLFCEAATTTSTTCREGDGSALTAGEDGTLLARQAARCLLGVILLDTINLDEAAGKTTPQDVTAVQRLCTLLNVSLPDRQRLFDTLSGLRMDPAWWLSLSVPQALRYDAKVFAYTRPADAAGCVGGGPGVGHGCGSDEPHEQVIRVYVSALCTHLSAFLSGGNEPARLGAAGAAADSTSASEKPEAAAPPPACIISRERLEALQAFVKAPAPEGLSAAADVHVMLSFCEGRRQVAVWQAPLTRLQRASHADGGLGVVEQIVGISAAQLRHLADAIAGHELLRLRSIPTSEPLVAATGTAASHCGVAKLPAAAAVTHSSSGLSAGLAGRSSSSPILLFEQGNTKASRKQFEPALREMVLALPRLAPGELPPRS
jgi:inorganic pyrophosphatase/exopolyphosphatase